jgi:hypothetical protein
MFVTGPNKRVQSWETSQKIRVLGSIKLWDMSQTYNYNIHTEQFQAISFGPSETQGINRIEAFHA